MTWFYAWPLGRGTLIFFGFSTSGMGPFRGRYRRFYHSTYWMFIESRKEKYSIPFWADLEGSEAPFSRLVSFGLRRTRLLWETMVFWPRGWPCWAPISRNTCSLGQKAPFKALFWPPERDFTWFYALAVGQGYPNIFGRLASTSLSTEGIVEWHMSERH